MDSWEIIQTSPFRIYATSNKFKVCMNRNIYIGVVIYLILVEKIIILMYQWPCNNFNKMSHHYLCTPNTDTLCKRLLTTVTDIMLG